MRLREGAMIAVRCRKGAALVEFAIVLSLLMVIIFGIAEFGIVMYDKAVVTNASREGARAGIVYGQTRVPLTTIQTTVNTYCSTYLVSFTTASPTTTLGGTGNACVNSGDELTVVVTYKYTFLLLPKLVTSLGTYNPLTLTATTVMRCE